MGDTVKEYDGQIVRVRDKWGETLTGIADTFSAEYALHEYGREEEGILMNGCLVYAGDIESIQLLSSFTIIRATEIWQQAGAYYSSLSKAFRISVSLTRTSACVLP